MSHFDPNYGSTINDGDNMGYDPPPSTSGLAVGSLVCSLICCIPPLPLIGALLGVIAALSIKGNPNKRGMGMAIAGIILGIVFTLAQVGIGLAAWKGYEFWRDAPAMAMQPGFDGNYEEFRSNFGAPGEAATNDQAAEFIDQLRSRYGAFNGSELDFQDFQGMQEPPPGATEMDLPWVLVFENQRVDAMFTFETQPSGQQDEFPFIRVRVIDPTEGDLIFPPASAVEDAADDVMDEDADEDMAEETGEGTGG